MKKEIERVCDADVTGPKKYKPFIEEAIEKFAEYIELYYKLGFVKAISLNVYFRERKER